MKKLNARKKAGARDILPVKINVTPEQLQALESLNVARAAASNTFALAYQFHQQKMQEIAVLDREFWNTVCTQFGFQDVTDLDGKGWAINSINENGKYVFVKSQKPQPATAAPGPETKQ